MPGSTSASTSFGDLDKVDIMRQEVMAAPHTHDTDNVGAAADVLEAPVPPDGGFNAWMQVFGAFFLFFATWGFVTAFGVYQNYYETELLKGIHASNISWIGSIQAFLLMFIGVLTGPLYDKGYFRALLYTGSVTVTFGIMMTSLCTKYWQILLAQGICVGLGTGCLFIPSVAVIAGYFTMKRSFATGLASTGGSIGGIVYSVTFRSLVDKIGFGWSTRLIGFLTMALLMVSISILKPLQFPVGRRSLLLPSAFKELPYTFTALALMLTFMGVYVPYFHIQTYAAEYIGLGKDVSYQLLTIMNVAAIFGRTIPVIGADKMGPINLMIPAVLGTTVMAFAWLGMKSVAATVLFAVLYGFLSGTVVSLPPTTIVSMGGKPSDVGTRMGMAFTFAATGLLTGNPMAAALIDIPKGKFRGAQIFCGCFVAAGCILFVVARLLLPKKGGRPEVTEVRGNEEGAGDDADEKGLQA
ncbi:hypothetical protein Dda_8945 [Drechslerella dactyloides]|uniref:Major facilitator superfamily (MFS) profile domain-containing protein n=1 Tax=Drechslerella dactyloides TaxID=74499 RepID=A0AAD6IRB8_DREDA|nr:hypothetical protein Dda_8945 [Drechslerella dactyloides]